MMLTVVSFLVAIAILIAVHEWGHYRMALACGVPVLRFSIGVGRPLLTWRNRRGTEFVIAALPLGGYVRMLDEREGPVPAAQRHQAFNAQPLRRRAAIVAAGPAANLLLAVSLFAFVAWWGVPQAQPVLASPTAGSLAERAGIRAGEWVSAVAAAAEAPQDIRSFDELRWWLTQAALDGRDLRLWLADGPQSPGREVVLPLSTLNARDVDARLFERIGIVAPWSAPLLGDVLPDGAAAAAGLRAGDRVHAVDGQAIADAQQLRALIRTAVDARGQPRSQRWRIERDGQMLDVQVTPQAQRQGDAWVGRVGAMIGAAPAMTTVALGPIEAVGEGVRRTAQVSVLTLKMLGKMLIGEASLRNLSGPLTIADYAGRSASLGWMAFLSFLALVSVSLGVLNLLPLPVLDGGHLMYYLWESVTGRPLPEVWMDRLQRGGAAILVALMSLAIFNDLARLLG
ncbi:MAG: RIP metalloprotease RseP [Tepidimonas sp.]|uniref:RIP metalloprotease RseP n=1 Tax=Tepidimonas sp. TaxID=2002775 RepID=UPI00405508AE